MAKIQNITIEKFLKYQFGINSSVFRLISLNLKSENSKKVYDETLEASGLTSNEYEYIFDNYDELKKEFFMSKHINDYNKYERYYYKLDYNKFKREFVKKITKLLRKNGIKSGIVNDNGTTSPNGADKYSAYIPLYIKPEDDDFLSNCYMSFTMDKLTGKKIKDILDENKINYTWENKDSACFVFGPLNWSITEVQ